jgi:hypothetical protein
MHRVNDTQMATDRQRRLAELDHIIETQADRNSDLTEETADALIQRDLAEDRQAKGDAAHQRETEPSGNHVPEDRSHEKT